MTTTTRNRPRFRNYDWVALNRAAGGKERVEYQEYRTSKPRKYRKRDIFENPVSGSQT